MTDSNYTAISVLLDRSGSMQQIRTDAEGGLRQFISDQQKVDGKCTLRLAQFDNMYEVVHESTPIKDVPPPSLLPRGSTALLDSWGRCMAEFGEELAALPEDQRPGHVVFVVVTDGMENASREWTRDKVFAKVTEQTDRWGWEFLFLAANQDAVAEGQKYGVVGTHSLDYSHDSGGTQAAYAAMSATVTRSRVAGQSTAGFTEDERSKSKH